MIRLMLSSHGRDAVLAMVVCLLMAAPARAGVVAPSR